MTRLSIFQNPEGLVSKRNYHYHTEFWTSFSSFFPHSSFFLSLLLRPPPPMVLRHRFLYFILALGLYDCSRMSQYLIPWSIHLQSGVSNLLASLGHTGRVRVVLGCTLNTQTLLKTKKSHNVLSKFMILCWAAFIAILGHMPHVAHRLQVGHAWYIVTLKLSCLSH